MYNISYEEKFFNFGIDDIVTMEKSKFNEFIVKGLGLSINKNDPLYWKNPDNYKTLLNGLLDLSLQYTKKQKK